MRSARLAGHRFVAIAILTTVFAALLIPMSAAAQILVDCSGANPNAFPSITAALPSAGPGSTILVTGTCNENVFIQGATSLNLGAWFGQTATINGNISIDHSPFVYLYGLNVTNPSGDGIDVGFSEVILDTCTSNGNGGNGLNAIPAGNVVILAAASFDGNGGSGISAGGNSWVGIATWLSPADISNNLGPGFNADASMVGTVGNITVTNNGSPGAFGGGPGILLLDGAIGNLGSYWGVNLIQGNFGGGIAAREGSRMSVFGPTGGTGNTIQNNGPFGVQAAQGAQVTIYEPSVISDHSGPGVDVLANSQAFFFGATQVLRNGTSSDPRTAGVRVDGNSEAYFRGGTVSQNSGPGILALVNSSADFAGMTFSDNSGGIITCDTSAFMVSDFARPALMPSVHCKTPHALGGGRFNATPPKPFDLSRYLAMEARYKKIATKR